MPITSPKSPWKREREGGRERERGRETDSDWMHKDPEDETSSSLWEMQDNRQSWWHNLQEEGWMNEKRHCKKIQVQRLGWESSPWQLESNTEAQGIFTAEEYLMHCPWKKHQSWLPWCQDCNTTELGCHWVPEKAQKAALKNTSFSSWCFPE